MTNSNSYGGFDRESNRPAGVRIAVAVQGAATSLLMLVVAACSGANSDIGNGATCGAAVCVAADGGAGASDATADAASNGDADSDARPQYLDDPCPTTMDEVLNCTDTCTAQWPPTQTCWWGSDADGGVFTIKFVQTGPYIIRVKTDFANQSPWNVNCGNGGMPVPPYAIRVDVSSYPNLGLRDLRIRVEPPLYLAPKADFPAPRGCLGSPPASCHVMTGLEGDIYVFAETPSIPAVLRNIVIDEVPDSGPACP